MIASASNGEMYRQGVGVGGMLVLLGLGFFLVGFVESRRARSLTDTAKDADSSAPTPPRV